MNGLTEDILREMSASRAEPEWMRDLRLAAHAHIGRRPMPTWVGDLSDIDLDDLPVALPPGLDGSTERGGHDDLEARGVVFCAMETAVREHPHLVQEHLGSVVPADDNPLAALNAAIWSSGSFVYVPPGVEVEVPLEVSVAGAERAGRFERTLIVADEGSTVHYIAGCSAPTYTSDALHAAVVEVVVRASARATVTTIQNWSGNVVSPVIKRATVGAEGHMTWIDANIGSRRTITHPAVVLAGPKATGEVRSVAYAGGGQHHDTGARMVHAAPETSSTVVSRSIVKDGGHATQRGMVRVEHDARGCTSQVRCDALLLDDASTSTTRPGIEVGGRDAVVDHRATVSRLTDEQRFYLQSRGLSAEQATGMIVNGFIEPVTRTLPVEYAVEWSRLIELQMEGTVG